MILMRRPAFDQPMYVRTTGQAKLALDRVVAELRASGKLKFHGKRLTQEALVNASWLWLEDMDVGEVEKAMGVYLPRLEAIMKGEPAPAAVPIDDPPATLKTPPSRATVEDFTPPTPRRKQRPG